MTLNLKLNDVVIYSFNYSRSRINQHSKSHLKFTLTTNNFLVLDYNKIQNVEFIGEYENKQQPMIFKSYRLEDFDDEVYHELVFLLPQGS